MCWLIFILKGEAFTEVQKLLFDLEMEERQYSAMEPRQYSLSNEFDVLINDITLTG